MKKLKAYKITDSSILNRVNKPSQITQALVNSVDWPAHLRGLCFDFKSMKLNPAKPLNFKLSPKYTASGSFRLN